MSEASWWRRGSLNSTSRLRISVQNQLNDIFFLKLRERENRDLLGQTVAPLDAIASLLNKICCCEASGIFQTKLSLQQLVKGFVEWHECYNLVFVFLSFSSLYNSSARSIGISERKDWSCEKTKWKFIYHHHRVFFQYLVEEDTKTLIVVYSISIKSTLGPVFSFFPGLAEKRKQLTVYC